ncbi:MAG: hypothetical protein WCC57_11265 [Paracoccaceae bacterium]
MNTPTDAALLRRTAAITLTRIALLGCWFVAIIWAYRQIGARPDGVVQAGVLALALAGLKLFSSALSDPLDMDVARQVPVLLADDPDKAVAVWRAAQQIRLGLGVVIVVLAVLLARPIAAMFLRDPTLGPVVMLAGGGAALEIQFRGYLSDCQSRERFGRFLIYEGGLQFLRILGLVVIAVGVGLDASGFLLAYGGATLGMVAICFGFSGAARQRLWLFNRRVSIASWSYLRWVAPAMLLSAVVERLDLFMLTSLRGPADAGLYGALLPLLLVPEMVAGFATHALQPRIAEMHARGVFKAFWASLVRFTLPVALLTALGVAVFAQDLIGLTIGPAYLAAAPVLRVLAAAVLLWVGIVPVALALVVMTRPRATLAITLVQAVVVTVAGVLLIPPLGALGAAWAVLAMRMTAGAMICAAALVAPRSGVAA